MSRRICLIVDDEPSIRSLLRSIFERESFTVIEGKDAAEAMRAVREHTGRLDLMVSDIKMPGDMSGVDLAFAVRASFPKIAIVLISGYSDDAAIRAAAKNFVFLSKPFKMAELFRAVERALESTGGR